MSKTRSYVIAAATLLALSVTAAAQPRPEGSTRDIVIVHGAFVDGSGWRAVYDILEKDGYHVSIVQAASQVPLAGSVFSAPTTAAAWRTKPSYAILTTRDIAANPDLQRWMYKRSGAIVTTVDSSHAVYISHRKIVAHVIEEAAKSSTGNRGEKTN